MFWCCTVLDLVISTYCNHVNGANCLIHINLCSESDLSPFLFSCILKEEQYKIAMILLCPVQEKKEEIWLCLMTKAHTPTEMSKGQSDNINNATKSSITQRLRTDLGRSVGVTTATQLVWLTGLRAHLPTNHNSRVIKRTYISKIVNKPPYIDNKPTATPSGEVIKIDTRKA